MIAFLLLLAVLIGIPWAYAGGKHRGFKRHACNYIRFDATADRAPATYVLIPCAGCGTPIACAIATEGHHIHELAVSIDLTDLRAHRMLHETPEVSA